MNDTYSYDKEEIKEILDYAIRKIEQNISTIKDQQIEIDRLKKELEISRNIPYNYNYEKEEQIKKELKENAKKEAELIINEARNNANKIINDALIETQKLDMKKEMLEKNIKQLKSKVREVLTKQFELIDEIEIL
ncbi:MAG TPA: DivIVA domain-containing protein [Bacilli bacterium]|nr:cell division initiation protein [Mycoplasma sp. CAG:611]HJJ08328.1 DivIVA domain-containing protein [Bacilli bacterium]